MAVNTCRHWGRFFCTSVTVEEGTTYAYACIDRCGFWLNFDPVYAGRTRDKPAECEPRFDSWNIFTLAFYPIPNPNREWKTPQPLAVEGLRNKP